MKIGRDIFLDADQKKQMEFMWDKLEEISGHIKNDRKKRYAITAASGFIGGCFVMVTMQAKILWKSIAGG